MGIDIAISCRYNDNIKNQISAKQLVLIFLYFFDEYLHERSYEMSEQIQELFKRALQNRNKEEEKQEEIIQDVKTEE